MITPVNKLPGDPFMSQLRHEWGARLTNALPLSQAIAADKPTSRVLDG